jgi:hypothetical protein
MSFGLLNTLMLLGLAAVIIPPIIHLFNRRRFDVVDWGAMQFLQINQTTRRRLRIDEMVLMLLRMGLIALFVLALAAPFAAHPVFATLGNRPNRDVVLIFDGSYSMGFTGSGQTPHEAAKEWATAFVKDLAAGDSVAVLQAKQQVTSVVGELTHDLQRVREAIAHLPAPRGGCSWPEAIQGAHQLLRQSKRSERDIIVLSDGQRFGWADETTLLRWELLATGLRNQPTPRPAIWVVNVDPHRPADPPNWSLAPLCASRAVASAGQQITFRTALQLHGQKEYRPPYRMYLEVDGRQVQDLKPPTTALHDKGQVPLSFRHRFATAGSHLVSVVVEPDPPLDKRPPGYVIKDQLPGDNRCDFAVEVVDAIPVLVVDGDARPNLKHRGTDFLRDALSPARDRTPVVQAKVVRLNEFTPALLAQNVGPQAGTPPRVLVLANVPRLTPEQEDGVARFLTNGGGLLVTLGERVEVPYYNQQLYHGGRGWLPAALEQVTGDETEPERAVQPLASSFFHPAVDLFREVSSGGLADARFPRWWRVAIPGRSSTAVPVALFSNQDPFLVERSYFAGRVLLCTVPLDNSWRTNLPNLPAFAPLAHELVYYLAGARAAEHNLQPGQPLVHRAPDAERSSPLALQPPTGETKQIPVAQWPLVYEDTRETGVYRLTTMNNRTVYYVVQPDHRESDLTPCDQADRDKVAKLVSMTYENDLEKKETVLSSMDQKQELWKWFLLGVLGLLLGEVWMTRRLAKSRSVSSCRVSI